MDSALFASDLGQAVSGKTEGTYPTSKLRFVALGPMERTVPANCAHRGIEPETQLWPLPGGARKIATLVRECSDYMRLTLKSTEMIESEKSELHDRAARESSALADTKLELSLIVRHGTAGCRTVVEKALSTKRR